MSVETEVTSMIQNIRTCLDTIYTNLPKVTGTEGTEVTLTPTLKGKLNIQEKGNSTQESTNGYQLWKPYNLTKTNTPSGINWVTSSDGTITASGTATANSLSASSNELTDYFVSLPAGTYTISGGTAEVKADVINSSGSRIKLTSGTDNFTLSETTLVQVRALVSSGTAISTPITIKPMLNTGSTAQTWEKYTGGIASPNPSYPQTIKSVTGNNNVVVSGKNLVYDKIEGYYVNNIGKFSVDSSYDMCIARVIQGETYAVKTDDEYLVCGFFTDEPTTSSVSYDNSRTVSNDRTFIAPITRLYCI